MANMPESYISKADEELARLAAEGERAGFTEVVRRYSRPLLLFAWGRMGSYDQAEDIVQETFMRAYAAIASFDSGYSLKNWLFTIAYRQIVSAYRKKKPDSLSEQAVGKLSAPIKDDSEWLWEVVGLLGPETHSVLWLRYKEGMTTAEIAGVMKKTRVSVRVLLHRSRKRLERELVNRPEITDYSHLFRNNVKLAERVE